VLRDATGGRDERRVRSDPGGRRRRRRSTPKPPLRPPSGTPPPARRFDLHLDTRPSQTTHQNPIRVSPRVPSPRENRRDEESEPRPTTSPSPFSSPVNVRDESAFQPASPPSPQRDAAARRREGDPELETEAERDSIRVKTRDAREASVVRWSAPAPAPAPASDPEEDPEPRRTPEPATTARASSENAGARLGTVLATIGFRGDH